MSNFYPSFQGKRFQRYFKHSGIGFCAEYVGFFFLGFIDFLFKCLLIICEFSAIKFQWKYSSQRSSWAWMFIFTFLFKSTEKSSNVVFSSIFVSNARLNMYLIFAIMKTESPWNSGNKCLKCFLFIYLTCFDSEVLNKLNTNIKNNCYFYARDVTTFWVEFAPTFNSVRSLKM